MTVGHAVGVVRDLLGELDDSPLALVERLVVPVCEFVDRVLGDAGDDSGSRRSISAMGDDTPPVT